MCAFMYNRCNALLEGVSSVSVHISGDLTLLGELGALRFFFPPDAQEVFFFFNNHDDEMRVTKCQTAHTVSR